ncbi:MAG: hypothetical protein WAT19_05440 [Ferruginibacter sp.]
MKDTKTILLLVLSGLLIVMSMVLFWMWGYRSGNVTNSKTDTQTAEKITKGETIASRLNESASSEYMDKLDYIGKSIESIYSNSDTLKTGLSLSIKEFYLLRAELNNLLASQPSQDNIMAASRKIEELQVKIRQLSITNKDIAYENKRLTLLLQQLGAMQKNIQQTSEVAEVNYNPASNNSIPPDNNLSTDVTDNRTAEPVKKAEPAGPSFTAFDLRLTAYKEADDNNSKETEAADETSKIVGAFTFRNNSTQNNSTDVFIVVKQPDGKVLQKSTWESGTFEPKDGQKMIYSCKLRYDYGSWEAKRLFFTLVNDNYQKGRYTMLVYHNGVVVARMSKQLS